MLCDPDHGDRESKAAKYPDSELIWATDALKVRNGVVL